jgi:hypothetical protein
MKPTAINNPTHAQEQPLPPFLRSLFWEFDIGCIDRVKHADTVMGRIMERGNWPAMRWLRRAYHNDQIVSFLERRGKKVLPPREVNYWALISGVPQDKRAAWVSEARRQLRAWRNGSAS